MNSFNSFVIENSFNRDCSFLTEIVPCLMKTFVFGIEGIQRGEQHSSRHLCLHFRIRNASNNNIYIRRGLVVFVLTFTRTSGKFKRVSILCCL